MSLKDLAARGALLPEELSEDPRPSISVTRILLLLTLGAGSCALVLWGGGGPCTWLGAVLYACFLVAFAFSAHRGVDRTSAAADAQGAPQPEDDEPSS